MTILDDLFKEAHDLWTAIQVTADRGQQVVVDAAMVQIPTGMLGGRTRGPPFNLPSDTLIYNPAAGPPFTPPSFVGSELTIFAPNFHTHLELSKYIKNST